MVTAILMDAPGYIHVIPDIRSTGHFDSLCIPGVWVTGPVSMAFSGVRSHNKLAIYS